jgi:hypothetical protein
MAIDDPSNSDVFASGTDENLKIENLGYQQGRLVIVELAIGKR